MRALRVLVLPLLLAGCSTGITQWSDKPLTFVIDEEAGDRGGVAKIFVAQPSGKPEFYHDGQDLFVAYRTGGSDISLVYVYGITREYKRYDNASNCPVGSECFRNLFPNRRYTAAEITHGGENPKYVIAYGPQFYIEARITRPKKIELVVEFRDRSATARVWHADYQKALQEGTAIALDQFVNTHTSSYYFTVAKTQLFHKLFDVKVIASSESAQRATTQKALLASMAGSCKDIVRTVRIAPKGELPKGLTQYFAMEMAYTLKRTYAPHQIAEDGDPLTQTVSHRLNPGNNFTITQDVRYDCVLTSGRFHHAGLSLAGALMGVKPEDAGINTTLEKTSFSYDIKSIR